MPSNQLAKINIGKKQLGLDEETYRAMLEAQTGKTSLRKMNRVERETVLNHMRACGAKFTAPKKKGPRPHNYDQLPEYVTKVEALLADMGLSWRYADSIARNITGGKGAPAESKAPGVERLAWVKNQGDWVAIIAALHVEQEKRGGLCTVDELLASIGKDRAWCEEQINPSHRRNWQRNRATLKAVIELLINDHGAKLNEK